MWTAVEIGGKPSDVFDPPGSPPRFAVLFLHPYGGQTLHDKPIYTQLLEKHGLACVCPPGGYSWWADRLLPEYDPKITAERYVLDRVMPFFQERWRLAPPAIGLFGISMGGQGALRLAFKHPKLFPVVAAVSSALEVHELYGHHMTINDMYDSKEHARQDNAILHVHPSHFPPHIFFAVDPEDHDWFRGNDRLHEKLTALGIPHECDLTTRAGGHSWDYFNHMAERVVQFLVKGLEQESRRLL
jgi:S-formylglutathione hydrolase